MHVPAVPGRRLLELSRINVLQESGRQHRVQAELLHLLQRLRDLHPICSVRHPGRLARHVHGRRPGHLNRDLSAIAGAAAAAPRHLRRQEHPQVRQEAPEELVSVLRKVQLGRHVLREMQADVRVHDDGGGDDIDHAELHRQETKQMHALQAC